LQALEPILGHELEDVRKKAAELREQIAVPSYELANAAVGNLSRRKITTVLVSPKAGIAKSHL
jgi:hypothetical protein